MQQAAVAMAIILTIICLWWALGYARRRARSRRRHR